MNIEKQELIKVLDLIESIVDYNNKNLTKKQYYDLDNAREILLEVLKNMED